MEAFIREIRCITLSSLMFKVKGTLPLDRSKAKLGMGG